MNATPRSSGIGWSLGNVEEQRRASPGLVIASRRVRGGLTVEDRARLSVVFHDAATGQQSAETMWVEVLAAGNLGYVGGLYQLPVAHPDLAPGDVVLFRPEHVIATIAPRSFPYEAKVAFAVRRLFEDPEPAPGRVIHEEGCPPLGPDGPEDSGWVVSVGDETEEELNDPARLVPASLGSLISQYPPFGDLVLSGARDGWWILDKAADWYGEPDELRPTPTQQLLTVGDSRLVAGPSPAQIAAMLGTLDQEDNPYAMLVAGDEQFIRVTINGVRSYDLEVRTGVDDSHVRHVTTDLTLVVRAFQSFATMGELDWARGLTWEKVTF